MNGWLTAGWILALAAAMWALDRFATWMESRGWIYWRKSRGYSGRLGGAFLEVQSLLEPQTRHIIEARQEKKRKETRAGDPPSPGSPTPS